MNYINASLSFKIKKAIRYWQLYGSSRTLAKVRGQYHMKRRFAVLPAQSAGHGRGKVGLIGCGNFAFSNIAYYLHKNYGLIIKSAMDVNIHHAASLFSQYRLSNYTNDASFILKDPEIEYVYIASNHASHAEYAIEALNHNKHVHIEKPHAVSEDQLQRLCAAASKSDKLITLGFNRPGSFLGLKIKEALDSQPGAVMLNWFLAGHEISPDHWYFEKEEGGRILGNLSHWTDFVYQMVPEKARYPIRIIPTRANTSDCDIAVNYVFGDGSIAAITFSAKGHTFEGVRERFSAHKGNVLISMHDFQTLTIENNADKKIIRLRHRDHGHEHAITKCIRLGPLNNRDNSANVRYLFESGELFLKTRQAFEENRELSALGWQGPI